MKFEHVIWDWNGTLYDDVGLCLELTNNLLKPKISAPLTLQQYRETIKHPMIEFYRDLVGDCDEDTFLSFSVEFHDHYKNRRLECGIHKGAFDTLNEIKKRNVHQSILSLHPQPLLDEIIDHLQIKNLFNRICGASDHMAGSKVDAGKKLVNEFNGNVSRTVLVGDTDHDAEVAAAIGIQCILIPNGFQSRERLQRCGVPVIDSIDELTEALS